MKGDFSRDSFDPKKSFTRVLLQQGRVQLDADWNEQVAIFWNYIRQATSDILGPYAGPEDNCGFQIYAPADDLSSSSLQDPEKQTVKALQNDFLIGPGRYYVNGILCENRDYVTYSKQPYLHRSHSISPSDLSPGQAYLIYLDVWEQCLSGIEDPSFREVALGTADTTARARVVWQVRALKLEKAETDSILKAGSMTAAAKALNSRIITERQPGNRGWLDAQAKTPSDPDTMDPCIASPDAQYRGPENQLYRVEIHAGGTANATFKWSRENGSVSFPVTNIDQKQVTLANWGPDTHRGLSVGNWVEVSDDDSVFGEPAPLSRIEKVEHGIVTLNPTPKITGHAEKHPLLRRWDHRTNANSHGTISIKEGEWLPLEDGIQIQFRRSDKGDNHYRPGDYWLIPARTATSDILWPRNESKGVPPHGVEHFYAPLVTLSFENGVLKTQSGYIITFGSLTELSGKFAEVKALVDKVSSK